MTTPTAADTVPRDRRRASGADLRAALQSSAVWLSANAERINALNVFPVPDGDTGTNMSLTFQAAVDALRGVPDDASAGDIATAAYEAAIRGARGGSWCATSQQRRSGPHGRPRNNASSRDGGSGCHAHTAGSAAQGRRR